MDGSVVPPNCSVQASVIFSRRFPALMCRAEDKSSVLLAEKRGPTCRPRETQPRALARLATARTLSSCTVDTMILQPGPFRYRVRLRVPFCHMQRVVRSPMVVIVSLLVSTAETVHVSFKLRTQVENPSLHTKPLAAATTYIAVEAAS